MQGSNYNLPKRSSKDGDVWVSIILVKVALTVPERFLSGKVNSVN